MDVHEINGVFMLKCVMYRRQFTAFRDAIIGGGIELSEPEEVVQPYKPGIDYDDAEAVADLERRQWLVYDLSPKSVTTKALAEQQRSRGRRRPRTRPTPLESPSWKAE
jgi:hypothetical protein